MKPEVEAQIDRERAAKHLDDATAKAFEEVRARGFEPFLLWGYSRVDRVYDSVSGPIVGQSYAVSDRGSAPIAVLVANDPKHTFEGLRFTGTPKAVAALIPTYNRGAPIRRIAVYDYDGELIYSEGRLAISGESTSHLFRRDMSDARKRSA
jgi:hypothetical protein